MTGGVSPVSAGELRVVEGPDAGRVVPISTSTVLGRDDSSDVVLADTEVSRRHLRVAISRGRAIIEDLGSTNGTLVNGAPLVGSHQLDPGDRIGIGATTLEYRPDPGAHERTAIRPAPVFAGEHVAQLQVVKGPGQGTSRALVGSITTGRDPDCDIELPDPEVSRHHAEVTFEGDAASLVDLGSTNGTFLNGERILGREQLEAGDVIQVGSAVIEFRAPGLELARKGRAAPEVSGLGQVLAHPNEVLAADTGSRKWWTLLVVCAGVFMLLLDTLIVSVALTPISEDLHASFTQLQWVVDAYALLLATLLLTAGSLSDIFGRKIIFTAGLAVFTVASAACGLSTSATMLDIFRGVQGIGGAMAFAPSLGLLVQEFPPEQRGIAFGVWGATTAGAAAFGPVLGGLLIEAFSWEAVFYVNIPLGAVTIYFAITKLVNLPGPETSVDLPGMVTFTVAASTLVFALIRGNDEGWTSGLIVGLLATAVIAFLLFLLVEARSKRPMLDLALFRTPTFNGAAAGAFGMSASLLALVLYLTLWMQSIQGFSALGAGLKMLVLTSVTMVMSLVGGKLSRGGVVPIRVLVGGGLGFMALGLGLMGVRLEATSEWTVLIPGMVLCGGGLGLASAPVAASAVSFVPPWRAGMAGGANSTFRQLGLVTGVAALGAVFQHQVQNSITSSFAGTPLAKASGTIADAVAAGGTSQVVSRVAAPARATVEKAANAAFTNALSDIILVAAAVALVCGLAGGILIRAKDAWTPPGADGSSEVE